MEFFPPLWENFHFSFYKFKNENASTMTPDFFLNIWLIKEKIIYLYIIQWKIMNLL